MYVSKLKELAQILGLQYIAPNKAEGIYNIKLRLKRLDICEYLIYPEININTDSTYRVKKGMFNFSFNYSISKTDFWLYTAPNRVGQDVLKKGYVTSEINASIKKSAHVLAQDIKNRLLPSIHILNKHYEKFLRKEVAKKNEERQFIQYWEYLGFRKFKNHYSEFSFIRDYEQYKEVVLDKNYKSYSFDLKIKNLDQKEVLEVLSFIDKIKYPLP
jgi:hypothetical protein